MIPGIEFFFERIGAAMKAALPDEWSSAEFGGRFFPGSSAFEAEYVRGDGTAAAFQPDPDGNEAVKELRELFRLAGRPVWGEGWFLMQPDGGFKVRFSNEGVDANGDLPFDEAAEAARTERRRQRLAAGQPNRLD